MKAAKPVAAIAILAVVAIATYVLVSRAVQTDLLVSNVVAAPIDGTSGSIGIFLTIRNSGGPDRLTAVQSIVAQRARLAHSVADAGLAIPSDSEPTLSPDGAYVLMDGMGGDLLEGRMLPITLRFEQAGEIRTQARIVAPQKQGSADGYGLFGLGDICTVKGNEPAPQIALEAEPDGDGWLVRVLAKEFTFDKDRVDGVHVPGTGHGHLYLGGLKLQRLFTPEIRIGALPPGNHEIRVTLNTNDHRAYVVDDVPVSATTEIIVR